MIKAIVTDIEGTTTSLAFVKEVLFPYSRSYLGTFVKDRQTDPIVVGLISDVAKEVNRELSLDEAIEQLLLWSNEDKKITPLKALQGLIWEDGYRRGAFVGHIYADVLPKLRQWHRQGISLYIYSSGSVYAQKLLFGNTLEGDLTPLFSGYFDTRIGGKRETESYKKIAQETGFKPEQTLFLSDIKEELDAAKAAGYQTVWLCRDSEPNATAEHLQVLDFNSIFV